MAVNGDVGGVKLEVYTAVPLTNRKLEIYPAIVLLEFPILNTLPCAVIFVDEVALPLLVQLR